MVSDKKYNKKQFRIISAIYTLIYLLAAIMERFIIFEHMGAITVWFPIGISFAAMLIYGKRLFPIIIFASMISNLMLYTLNPEDSFFWTIFSFLLTTAGPPAQAYAGYYLFNYFKVDYYFLQKGRDAFTFIIIALLVGLINSTILIICQPADIHSATISTMEIWTRLWISDLVGILILTPLILSIYKNRKPDISFAGVLEIVSIFVLTILFIQFLFEGWIQQEIINALPFLIIPIVLWIAFRFSPRETSITVTMLAIIIVLGWLNTSGPFIVFEGRVSLIGIQLYLSVTAIVGISLSVSVQERKQILKEYIEISNSLEKRVNKRTDELATLNKELLVEVNSRKKVESELKESEERNTALLSSLPDTIFLHDKNGTFLDFQSPEKNTLFFDPDTIIGKTIEEVLPEKVAEPIKKVFANTLNTHITQSHEYSLNINNKIKYYEARFSNCGENRVMSVIRDITNSRIAEKERKHLEEQVRHSAKLESLGVLAGGIAHDFNNLLTAIMGNAGLAIMSLPNKSKIKNNLNNIENASIRAADLCRQLLAYSGKGKFIIDAVDLNELVNEMSKLMLVSISKKVELQYNFTENIKLFEADSTQIRQIVMNLITNASEALGEKTGKIIIATGFEDCSRAFLKESYFDDNLEEGQYVFLEVVDNGVGMDSETVSKIFDPFFTTKFTGRGLGLAAVVGIVRSHKGAIMIESELKKGTKFKIYFPISKIGIEKKEKKILTNLDWKGSGTILVVDDEESIRYLAQATLKKTGLEVITANDGKEAVKIYKNKSKEINLVLMDLTMPKLSGEEAFKKLQEIQPDVKVVLSSGYSEQEATKKFNNIGLQGFLQKPYKPVELIEKVRSILDATI